eukprot:TRINITY_DN1050_c0_g1_i2.p1 TRINITY_DN1050_c0_g1~~TRINITY_DN1050_c0_g1_i2.p1  ORF type:complete len:363 (-),score=106.35 TRINITY_DN1050_c0_g1_i2:267-1355(-)
MGCTGSNAKKRGGASEDDGAQPVAAASGNSSPKAASSPSASTPAAEAPPAGKIQDAAGTFLPGVALTPTPVQESYDFIKKIGSGAFSIVHEATNKKTGERVAIKVVKKSALQGEEIVTLKREVENLRKLNHPNILKLFDVFESADEVYLVMELVDGQELFDKIIEKGNYSEKDASLIIRQIVAAIDYLHSQGIAHRDLKPENLLTSGDGQTEVIKVADFGLSKNFGEDRLKTSCGSPGYVAPEVLICDSPYDKSVDMWSIGVILYILLCGYPPFFADNDPALFKKIMDVDYNFDGEEWDSVSDLAKDLIQKLLTKDPNVRMTASQMKEHPWVKGETDLSNKKLQMEKLKEYQTRRKLIEGQQ